MTLVCRPKGRGNWHTVLVQVEGKRIAPLLVRVGELLTIGGVVFRICEVRA